MAEMHSLLARQIRKCFGDDFSIPKEWRTFVERVNEAYLESDADRAMVERSMDLSSKELMEASEALRESEEKHRLLVQNLHAGVVVHAPDTHIILANEQAAVLLGLTVDQMMGKTAIDL